MNQKPYFVIASALAFALCASGQTVASPVVAASVPYTYFGESGLNYDYYGKIPAATTGFGVKLGSNAFLVTDVDSAVGTNVQATGYATLREAIEYHVSVSGNWEFIGLGAIGVTTAVTQSGTATAGEFTGGVGLSYDLGDKLSRGKFHLPAVGFFRIQAITATEVKPVYGLMFRKTF